MRPARAPGRAGGRPARQQGRARCVCVLIVAAARRADLRQACLWPIWPMAYDAPGGGVGRYARPA
eukprot:4974380-Prymnesium_polylepis.1